MDRIERIENFINKAKVKHHGESYDYSKVYETYIDSKHDVCIIDHSLKPDGTEYGEFWMTPSNHLKGQKNPSKRGERISSSKIRSTEEYILLCKEKHKGENLDYSQTVYLGAHKNVYIIDHSLRPDGTEYGGYWQEANAHLRGCGHPDKAIDQNAMRQRSNTEEFILRGKLVHCDDDIDYSIADYKGSQEKLWLICNKIGYDGKIHGPFEISPDNFLAGKGCPKCGNHLSKAEDAISDFMSQYIDTTEIEKRNHTILNGKELDIYFPKYKLAIEYNGLRWHSEEFNKDRNYHLRKLEECEKQDITLIQIFEDEYLYHKNIVLNKIKHILGFSDGIKIGARKCTVTEISNNVAKEFLDKYHIQGYIKSTVYIGCFYNNNLIGVMTFIHDNKNNNKWNLARFATNYEYICQGVGGKLFKYFINKYNPSEIKTFLDRRWEHNVDNNLYVKLGFTLDSIERPDYRYTKGHGERLHKFGFRKQLLHKKYNLPLTMTENEMTKELGYYKIWDCGLIKYIWRNNNGIA